MIQINEITKIPEGLPLLPYAKEEYDRSLALGLDIVGKSEKAVLVSDSSGPGFVVGVRKFSLIGIPYLWFLMCRRLRPLEVSKLKRLKKDLFHDYQLLVTGIEPEFEDGKRFAKFLGFKKTGAVFYAFGHVYDMYEARL